MPARRSGRTPLRALRSWLQIAAGDDRRESSCVSRSCEQKNGLIAFVHC
jgi:hypothetical protein